MKNNKISLWIARVFETIITIHPIYDELSSEEKLRVLGEVKQWVKAEETKLE